MGQFVLVNLEGKGTYVFDFFPREIQSESRSNWEAQDTTIGTKPLFYGNRDPQRLTIDELWLDRTAANESIEPDITGLFDLQNEDPKLGRPRAVLALWGDRQVRCVLENINVREQFFNKDGSPQRARVSLQLIQLQDEGTAVGVTISG